MEAVMMIVLGFGFALFMGALVNDAVQMYREADMIEKER